MDEMVVLKPKLTRLKLSGVLETLSGRLDQAMKEKWHYTQFLDQLLSDEVERRDHKQLSRRLVKSGLAPDKTLETFDSVQRRVMWSAGSAWRPTGLSGSFTPHKSRALRAKRGGQDRARSASDLSSLAARRHRVQPASSQGRSPRTHAWSRCWRAPASSGPR
jgi:IstB-like ATP binding protein